MINTMAPNARLATQANSALFDVLGSDSLLFLVGIWTNPPTITGLDAETTRYVALRHAKAFLLAQPVERPTDFQVIVPSLLSAVHASDKRIRLAAMECIGILYASAAESKPTFIYAYDQVYGEASCELLCICSGLSLLISVRRSPPVYRLVR